MFIKQKLHYPKGWPRLFMSYSSQGVSNIINSTPEVLNKFSTEAKIKLNRKPKIWKRWKTVIEKGIGRDLLKDQQENKVTKIFKNKSDLQTKEGER